MFPTGEVSLKGTRIRWMSKQQSGKKIERKKNLAKSLKSKKSLAFMTNKRRWMWPDQSICREMNAVPIEIRGVKDCYCRIHSELLI